MNRRPDVLSERELQARAADLAQVPPDDSAPDAASGLLIVSVNGSRIGLELSMVREVITYPWVTPLPLTPPCIAGVVNLRYGIFAALDLAALRGAEPRAGRAFAVIVEHDALSAAVLVDAIEEVAFDADRSNLAVLGERDVLQHPELLPFRGESTGP